MRRYKNHFGSLVLALLTHLAAAVTVLVLGFLVSYVLVRGVPNLRPEMFALTYTSENQSMLPAIINTCTMTLFSLLVAVPFGVGSAIYLVEYAQKGSKIVSLVRVTTETLSGIPSIVYGLFGMLFFSGKLHFGYSMLSGALTLSIMILPLIMRTTEEALLSVPDMYREGSFGLGAGRLRTVARIVLPTAMCCERNNARAWWFPVRATKKVTQYYEARTDEQVTVDLCNLLNPPLLFFRRRGNFSHNVVHAGYRTDNISHGRGGVIHQFRTLLDTID